MLKDEYKVYEEKMKKSIESVMSDFDTVRAGRANASVLNRISVDYYGTPTPIQQIALYRLSRPADAGHHPLGRQHPQGYRKGHSGVRSWASIPRTTASASVWLSPS